MTLGERIAALRKGQGLSQEALGERLGVSRQAVSKWESDSTVPDVENCVAMSRVFAIPLSRLLGIEEETSPAEELTEGQLRMVEEIVDRYLSALPQPEPAPPVHKRNRWLTAAAVGIVLVLAAAFWQLNGVESSVSFLNNELYRMQIDLQNMQASMEDQGEIMANRVQEALDAQVNLLAGMSAWLEELNLDQGEATFRLTATPRLAMEGDEMAFLVTVNDQRYEAPGVWDGLAYVGDVTIPLTDGKPTFYAALDRDGAREVQQIPPLDYYDDLKSRSAIQLESPGNSGEPLWPAYQTRTGWLTPVGAIAVNFEINIGDERLYPTEKSVEIEVLRNGQSVGVIPMDLEAMDSYTYNAPRPEQPFAYHWSLPVGGTGPGSGVNTGLEKDDVVTLVIRAYDDLGRTAEIRDSWRYDGGNVFYTLEGTGLLDR